MGSTDSKDNNNLDLINEYTVLKTEYDQRFGEVTIYKHKKLNELVLVKEKIFDSQSTYERTREMANVRSKMNQDHVCSVIYSNCKI